MEEKAIVYVAGNPDAYPLEYYNEKTEAYEGVIPELLREFSAESSYEVIYYQADSGDKREQLAENLQVDLVSGYREGDALPEHVEAVTLFRTSRGGEETAYYLCFTEAAPESLRSSLKAFIDEVQKEEVSGILMEEAVAPRDNAILYWTAGGLSLAVVLLLTALALLVRHYRVKLKKARQEQEADETTGLGNLDYLTRYYRQLVNDKNRILYQLLYFYVDTERLRRLGGGEETDEFLRYCGAILQEYTADTDILARISDQGFVMLKLCGDAGRLREWMTPVLGRVREYSRKYAKPFEAYMTAGVYPMKAEDRDLNEMIFNASQAARMADRDKEEFEICTDKLQRKLAEEKQLQAGMEEAFAREEFQLYIQFYVDARSFEIVGGEALSRWNHPQKGILLPDIFVPLMEREKLIDRLDFYCLKKVCAFLEDLWDRQVEHFFVSCNFSRETFAAAGFAAACREILDACHFPKEWLSFEITESASVRDMARMQQNILELREYGINIALDDFGKGFTSFYDLQRYPVDRIKLDKELVDNVTTRGGNAVIKAMIQAAHELDVLIYAEGVETDGQAEALKELHCDFLQGYRFYYPLPDWEAGSIILKKYGPGPG